MLQDGLDLKLTDGRTVGSCPIDWAPWRNSHETAQTWRSMMPTKKGHSRYWYWYMFMLRIICYIYYCYVMIRRIDYWCQKWSNPRIVCCCLRLLLYAVVTRINSKPTNRRMSQHHRKTYHTILLPLPVVVMQILCCIVWEESNCINIIELTCPPRREIWKNLKLSWRRHTLGALDLHSKWKLLWFGECLRSFEWFRKVLSYISFGMLKSKK